MSAEERLHVAYQLRVPDGRSVWRVVDLYLQLISDRLVALQTLNELLSEVVDRATVAMTTRRCRHVILLISVQHPGLTAASSAVIIIIIMAVRYQTEPDGTRSAVLWNELVGELTVVDEAGERRRTLA